MSKPPIVIAHDFKTHRPEDVPDEFLDALEAEIARNPVTPEHIEYEDMAPSAQKIVDAGNMEPAGVFPTGLTREELAAWMKERFGV
jgi:hypothetical protein